MSSAGAAEFYNEWATARLGVLPTQNAPLADPDSDGSVNAVEFTYGGDPRIGSGIPGAIAPRISGTSGMFAVEILQRAGRAPGAQIDLDFSANLTRWIRPWWQRSVIASRPADPPGSVRELFTTRLSGIKVWFIRSDVRIVEAGPENARYYVAPTGSDANPGSVVQPFATLAKAVGLANPGDLIYVRGGTYSWTQRVALSRSGTPAQPIRVRAFPGEQPVFDFAQQTSGNGLQVSGNYWQLYGFEISRVASHGLMITGTGNLIERCVTHDCRDSGTEIYEPGAFNVVLNCDSYRNYDAINHGENADGFAAKFALGPGNVFRGCRSWENSDDGWDMWMAPYPVLIENCWAFRNGINFWNDTAFAGDGNGVKLGGNFVPAAHRMTRCLSFKNVAAGYDQNNNTAGLTVDHNTAWSNTASNFNLNHGTVTQGVHVLRNNLSIAGTVSVQSSSTQTKNSWQLITSPVPATTDVLSIDTTLAQLSRREDGGLPESPLLRPVPGGRLGDKGADLGETFAGSAPDLGAYETLVW